MYNYPVTIAFMKKQLVVFLLLIIPAIMPLIAEEDEISVPAFGNQAILTLKGQKEKILARKILGSNKYKLTPGDTYKIIIKIGETESQPLILDENYLLEIPFIGTVNVKNMYFSELRLRIIREIKKIRVVEFVDFILESPALFDVFIYGGVKNPGIVTITSVNTLWEAIVLANGFIKGASYRKIELLRNGKKTIFDLSRFIRDGDLAQNPLLEPQDRIYIPHAQILTNISGKVYYPDTYELLPGDTLNDLLQIAGGLQPDSEDSVINIFRLTDEKEYILENINLEKSKEYQIKNGDKVVVKSSFKNKEAIIIEGALYSKPPSKDEPNLIPEKPIVVTIPYMPGITLLQILDSFGGPTPLADSEKSYILRKQTGERLYVDIRRLWENREEEKDIKLLPQDHIFVPMINMTVIVSGQVNTPGIFPFRTGATVSDYVKLSGGIDIEQGDLNGIYLVDEIGSRTRIPLKSEVTPGSLIYVDKTPWHHTTYFIDQISIIIGFAAAIITLSAGVVNLLQDISR